MTITSIRIPPRFNPQDDSPDAPLIRRYLMLRTDSDKSTRQQYRDSGVSMSSVHGWKRGYNRPSLAAFERALNGIGYKLAIVKMEVRDGRQA